MLPSQLRAVCSTLTPDTAVAISAAIDGTLKSFDCTSLKILRMFVAQTAHESGEYKIKGENLNYSSVDRLQAIWPSHFKDRVKAQELVHNPQGLGKYIYGMGSIAAALGNIVPQDGWELRGSGPLQTTGRESFTKFWKWLKSKNMLSADESARVEPTSEALWALAHLVREDDKYGMLCAGWEFFVNKKLGDPLLITGNNSKDCEYFTRKINGGIIGLDSRQRYYESAIENLTQL